MYSHKKHIVNVVIRASWKQNTTQVVMNISLVYMLNLKMIKQSPQ